MAKTYAALGCETSFFPRTNGKFCPAHITVRPANPTPKRVLVEALHDHTEQAV
jgi:hypothetical protein